MRAVAVILVIVVGFAWFVSRKSPEPVLRAPAEETAAAVTIPAAPRVAMTTVHGVGKPPPPLPSLPPDPLPGTHAYIEGRGSQVLLDAASQHAWGSDQELAFESLLRQAQPAQRTELESARDRLLSELQLPPHPAPIVTAGRE